MSSEETFYRLSEPAPVIDRLGTKYWYNKDGRLHREFDQPAVIQIDGTREWWLNGVKHRENDQPAVIRANGNKFWFKHGLQHRENDLPAVIRANGNKFWFKHGLQHRENGPAAIDDGHKEYWINGVQQDVR